MKPLSKSDLEQMLKVLDIGDIASARSTEMSPPLQPVRAPAVKIPDHSSTSEIAQFEEALAFISPDVLRGNGNLIDADGMPVQDYWLGVILAGRRHYGDPVKEVLRNWSQQSLRYLDGDGFDHAWNQYDPEHPKPVTIASFLKLAQAKGWKGSLTSAVLLTQASRFSLLGRDEIMAQPPLRWRVKGIFPEIGCASIFGPSQSAKSFLGLDLCASIADGNPWFGHRTKACPVTYVMLEAESALRNRIDAWERHNGRPMPNDFKAIIQPFDLTDPKQVEELGATLPKGGVVMIDTLNRAAPGLDENSSQDMGLILAGMKRLQEITGGLVIVVHHTGKDASKGMRGHSSLHAALDGAIEVERAGNARAWSIAKVKDGEDGKKEAFKLEIVELGVDDDGDKFSSCAVSADTVSVFTLKEPKGLRQKSALATIRKKLLNSETKGKGGAPEQSPCVRVEEAISLVAATLVTEPSNKRNNRARTVVTSLAEGKFLQQGLDSEQEGWVW